MPLRIQEIAAPGFEPLTAAEVKEHLRIDISDEDTLIDALITAAREKIEGITNKSICSRDFSYFLPRFPTRAGAADHPHSPLEEGDAHLEHLLLAGRGDIILPRAPVSAVSYVRYTDSEDVVRTVDANTYRLDNIGEPGRIVLKRDQDWPSDYDQLASVNAIEVRFTAGYADAASIPKRTRQAILLLIGHLYENREAVVVGRRGMTVVEVPKSVDWLIDDERMFTF